MNIIDSFFLKGNTSDSDYCYLRTPENQSTTSGSRFVEELWAKYGHLADTHFKKEAMSQFLPRFWEMYLGVTLLDKGYDLHNPGGEGPDFYITDKSQKIWVEATAPGPGTTADAVPSIVYGAEAAWPVPEEQIILRITNAVEVKHKKHLEDIQKDNTIQPTDPYILAINGNKFSPHISNSDAVPYNIKALFPLGGLSAQYDTKSKKIVDTVYRNRSKVSKKNGEKISTDIFLNTDYAIISGIIFSNVDPLNKPRKMGGDFIFVHNPMAKNKLPLGFFKFGREFWLEEDKSELNVKAWS